MNQYAMLTLSVDDEIVLSTHEIDTIEQLFSDLELPNPDEKLIIKKTGLARSAYLSKAKRPNHVSISTGSFIC